MALSASSRCPKVMAASGSTRCPESSFHLISDVKRIGSSGAHLRNAGHSLAEDARLLGVIHIAVSAEGSHESE